MNEPTTPGKGTVVVDVYWRPGCPYCSALRRDLWRRRVPSRWHNVWQDEAARSFVRAANAGNETVPTVRVRTTTLTNPRGALVAGEDIRIVRARPWRLRLVVSWLPTAEREPASTGDHAVRVPTSPEVDAAPSPRRPDRYAGNRETSAQRQPGRQLHQHGNGHEEGARRRAAW